ncbi:leucine-rich repeat-containing protein 40-like [Acyrthosiphon pisum]|uniref:Leucine-rich repeat-containing protein 27 n=1 Tax=Acyrthosiphon pisum TaxID=7029 RepID=A0A8R1W6K1_ACYPI|nr:leucine-rich repeat-containing protein 40-like [Acyrthosiphon pisum]|eukprot:XP_003246391.1 PREDICTED: leucine-rich repeat-containing protein 40-like [Acyrthosiphon pisum]
MEIVILKNRNIMSISESLMQEIGCFVRYLYLANNFIRTLPDELFTGCTHLMWLDLRCNRIRRLPDGIQGHKNLQVLLLGKNDLKRLPLTLGSLPKLRELHVAGNPLDCLTRDMVKKGSKYLISFLQEKWKSDQNIMETTQLNNDELNVVKKIEDKILKKNKKNKKNMATSKMQLMERYSWPMIFLTNWSSDRLVTDRDIRMKELERLYLEKQKVILEKQERILQSYKDGETLKIWRDKAKQLQYFENSHKLKNYRGLEVPFGVNKEFSKIITRQTYRKESMENINYKNAAKRTVVKPFDFDLEMSDIYKMLMSLTSNNVENTNSDKKNDLKISNIDWEIQKLHDIQKRISQLKMRMI